MRYTTNGDVPTEASPAFPASGITTNESTVLSVRAYSNDGSELPSPVKDATFIVDEFAPILPTFSIITDYDNLWDWNTGIYVMGPKCIGGISSLWLQFLGTVVETITHAVL